MACWGFIRPFSSEPTWDPPLVVAIRFPEARLQGPLLAWHREIIRPRPQNEGYDQDNSTAIKERPAEPDGQDHQEHRVAQ